MAVLKLPRKSDIAKECVERFRSMGKDTAASSWGKTGPTLFTRVLREEDRLDEARPRSEVYPVTDSEVGALYQSKRRKGIEEKVEGTSLLHIWNEMSRRIGIHKDVRPPEGSYLDEWAKDLGFTWPCPEVQYSEETIRRLAENYRKTRDVKREIRNTKGTLTWKLVTRLNSAVRGIKSRLGI